MVSVDIKVAEINKNTLNIMLSICIKIKMEELHKHKCQIIIGNFKF